MDPALQRILAKIQQLKAEGLALYTPLPTAEKFHACRKKWRVCDGSNRAGKTQAAMAECVRAWLGVDPYDKHVRRDGLCLVVGRDGDHLAMLWRKVAEEGSFYIIRDEETHIWRSVRPDPDDPTKIDPYDEAYREKWKPAPPLLPQRTIVGGEPAWEDFGKGIPRLLKLTSGWNVMWRSSLGKPPQGAHLNLVEFDEHLNDEAFYYEAARGLVALNEPRKHWPKGIWSATPQNLNPQLLDLREAADAGSETSAAFSLFIKDNPYIPAEERQTFYDSIPEDERAVRIFGEYASVGRRIYRSYDPNGVHGCEPFEVDPKIWTRYVILDPGTQHCGTLFGAVDPDEKHVYIYDGFDLRGADATRWAYEVAQRQNGRKFEAAVIDQQMGKQHPPGFAENVAEQYWAALVAIGAEPRLQGSLAGFFPGTNDVRAREEAVLGWMAVRPDGPHAGTSRLQVMRGVLPELDKQIKRAQMSLKDPNRRVKMKEEDLVVCLEYFAGHAPYFHEPEQTEEMKEFDVFEHLQKKNANRRRGAGQQFGAAVELG